MGKLLFLLLIVSSISHAGLIRSVWGCSLSCESKQKPGEPLAYLSVAYCSTSALSLSMIETLTPLCQTKTKRSDVVAVRASKSDVATCVSSSNPCPTEGLTRAGFTCHYICPSDDKVIRKFTACASTGDEAWSYATQFCKDAVPPDGSFTDLAHNCTAEGQTPCE